MRILFTGGTGKAGRHVIPYLESLGHRVLNIDLQPLEGAHNLIADIADTGQMHDAMRSLTDFDELEADERPTFDAVVHFAALARILIKPDAETFRVNAMGTWNVIDAALKAGIPKVIFASSETTYGVCFAQGERKPDYLPIDEDHPVVPEDPYAISKVTGERIGEGLQRRYGADVYGLRINNVIEPHEYAELGPKWRANPEMRLRNFFAYIDVRDLGQMVERCLQTDGLGYEVFNVSNDDSSVGIGTDEIIERFYQGVEIRGEMGEHDTFYSSEKAKQLVGFKPTHGWREG
jgi:nucleoside-diphosphate-sugar epimerase